MTTSIHLPHMKMPNKNVWIVFQDNVKNKAIDIITITGCSLSLIALLLTVAVHAMLWRWVLGFGCNKHMREYNDSNMQITLHFDYCYIIYIKLYRLTMWRIQNKCMLWPQNNKQNREMWYFAKRAVWIFFHFFKREFCKTSVLECSLSPRWQTWCTTNRILKHSVVSVFEIFRVIRIIFFLVSV